MHYKPKHVPRDGYVANADELMKEFNRAELAGNELDQNNLKDLGVLVTHPPAPSGSGRSTTFTHDDGTLLLVNPNSGTAEAMTTVSTGTASTVRGAWIPIFDGAGTETPVALEFTLLTSMTMIVIGQVQWEVASGSSSAFLGISLRLVVDGVPQDTIQTVPAEQDGSAATYWSACVEENVFLQPGPHRIEMQGAELRQNDLQVASTYRRTILAMGFPR